MTFYYASHFGYDRKIDIHYSGVTLISNQIEATLVAYIQYKQRSKIWKKKLISLCEISIFLVIFKKILDPRFEFFYSFYKTQYRKCTMSGPLFGPFLHVRVQFGHHFLSDFFEILMVSWDDLIEQVPWISNLALL